MPEANEMEHRIRTVEDNVLLIHRDLKEMSTNVGRLASAMEKLTEIQFNQKLMEERMETRHAQLKKADTAIHERIDKVEEKCVNPTLIENASKGAAAHGYILWTAKIIILGVLGTAATAIIWAIKMGA